MIRYRDNSGRHRSVQRAAPVQPAVGSHTSVLRRAVGEHVVPRARVVRAADEGEGVVPEAAEVLGDEPAAPQAAKGE